MINGILLYTARVPVHVHGNGDLRFTLLLRLSNVAACQISQVRAGDRRGYLHALSPFLSLFIPWTGLRLDSIGEASSFMWSVWQCELAGGVIPNILEEGANTTMSS